MENKLNDLIRLAEGKMTLERFRQSYDIFEPLTDEEYLAIVNRNYLYEPIQDGKSYKRIRVDENGNRTGVPNETREQRKAIDYANSVTIDFFEIGKLQMQLQKEVKTASIISKVDEIEQQIEALWVKLFGNNKPSICSVIPRSLLINIYDNFSDYLDYPNALVFADAILFDNVIKCKGDVITALRYLFTHVFKRMNEAGSKEIKYTILVPKIFGVSTKGNTKPDNKKHKIYTIIDPYLLQFDPKNFT